jgi:hypothetical protein
VNVYYKGKGNAQESQEDVEDSFPVTLFSNFYENTLSAIHVENVTYMEGSGGPQPVNLETMYNTLTVKKGSLSDRAKQQYLAMLLNVASQKLMTHTVVSEDGHSASEAIQEVASLILDGDPTNDETAKDIADVINNGLLVPAGVISDSWEYVPYKATAAGVPKAYTISKPHPNPFNPFTTIELSLPQADRYELKIYDVSGRLVRRFQGASAPGVVRVVWDGRDEAGRRVSSGVYMYTAKVGPLEESRKMLMLK